MGGWRVQETVLLKGKEPVAEVLQTWLGAENQPVLPKPFILKPCVPFPCKGAGREPDSLFWHTAWELRYPSWAIQTAEVRCLACPFHPQAPLKTSPERPMCRGWKKGRGNGGQTGVGERFQPPPAAGTWLRAACSTSPALAPHLRTAFCCGDIGCFFLQG